MATEGRIAKEWEVGARGREVLVVDDDEHIRELLACVLELRGFRTRLATNGREAVSIYREDPDRFGLVVSDIMMPEMDGLKALSALKACNPDVRVVFMTGSLSRTLEVRKSDPCVVAIVAKPFDLGAMAGVIEAVLKRRVEPASATAERAAASRRPC